MSHCPTSDYEEANYQKILRPQSAAKGKIFDTWITSTSPEWQRLAVVQLTRYLSLETGYRQDLNEYANSWASNKTTVFAITEDITSRDGIERQSLVGMLTFHHFDNDPVPVLYHCYLHPFFRNKGLMKKAWQDVQVRFPRFEIEPPLTLAMKHFLGKVDYSIVEEPLSLNPKIGE